ncbi:uncharacterized protein K452DRAFT_287555 [Aplosporella prunicola CBS 121167]|uniref:Methyltransferase domain-containing protein n=1 Tax=Aplosporella prunicola CBS 121167 TaxID=1176127 RepID=A0A6A6BE78_9PEZI|nr:uncharacterized protein K452DRAFT_287555 [Aplosporella prunicola CBS 121167]KAF2141605.1 hypothetical protein K452DRAFT_287555 [Aplosporella prunicola CBS 121167]
MASNVIEIDSGFDGDSAVGSIDDQLSAFSESLSSSVVAYPVEHGRRYHAYKDGAYFMPNDESEQDRLDMMHHMLKLMLDNKSFMCPIKEEQLSKGRILDVGTGTGIWAIEMADNYPDAEVIGNDLSPVQPTWVPPNVKFEVDDVESPWTHAKPFDFVFCRYMDGAISDWPALLRNTFEKTRPGGWAEYQAFDTHYKSDDGSLGPDSSINKFVATMEMGCEKLGKELYPGPGLEGWFKEAGFVNVGVHSFKLPLGPWAKDRKLKEVGMFNIMQVLDGMEAFSYRLFMSALGWSIEEVQVFIAKAVQEIKSKNVHSYYTFYVVYGQKPENA